MNTQVYDTPEPATLLQTRTPIKPEDTMSEAGRKVLVADFAKMLNHEAGSRIGEDIEHVHDMRVATRRMRSAFRLFEPYYKTKPIRPFVEQIKQIANALGAVRDLDVMLQDLTRYQGTLDVNGQDAMQPLLERLDKKRAKARKKLVAHFDGTSYQSFSAAYALFLTQPGSAAKTLDNGSITPHQVRHVLPGMLHDHLAAVRAYDDALGEADAPTMHALRIEFKRLRYAMSFFAEVLGASGSEFVEQIKAIQDHLGRMNDITVALAHLQPLLEDEVLAQAALADYTQALQAEYDTLQTDFNAVWVRFNTRSVQKKLADALLVLR
ncbi:MAG: CHAD domain-containing protein [Armatimonadetes bacterium]|nr:CHAD domain-containing protein [Anaerolineae bacterium]